MKKMKLPIVIATASVMILGVSGCTTASQSIDQVAGDGTTVVIPSEPLEPAEFDSDIASLLPDEFAESGKITAVTDPTFAPFQFYGSDNKTVIGWTPDLVTAIEQVLGVEIEMIPAAFDTMLPGIASGKYDMAVSAFSVTDERLQNADFVNYLVSGTGMGVPVGNPNNLSVDPLSMCGYTIAASKGTAQALETLPDFNQQCITAGEDEIDVKLFPSGNEANLALASGRIDGLLNDSIGMAYEAKLAGDTFEVAEGADIDAVPVGIALGKGSTLTSAIAAAVKKIISTGTYAEIDGKWGFPSSTKISVDQVDN